MINPVHFNKHKICPYCGEIFFYTFEEKALRETIFEIKDNELVKCESLASKIELPISVSHISHLAFGSSDEYCRNATNIVVPKSVTSIKNSTFSSLKKLTSIEISSYNPYFSSQEGVIFNKDKTRLISYLANKPEEFYRIPDSVIVIEECAFWGSEHLKKVIIPDSVTVIDNSAFALCNKLEEIKLPNSITAIGNFLFYKCSRLTTAILPNSILYIHESTFLDCHSLETIIVPNSVILIGERAFANCVNLTHVEIPNSVIKIADDAFEGCFRLL